MSRDHRKLEAFQVADALIADVYQATASFPAAERFGLQSQIRRAVVSIVTNIVEGSARRTGAEYCRFLEIAFGSARELDVLIQISERLGMLPAPTAVMLLPRIRTVQAKLACLIRALSPKP